MGKKKKNQEEVPTPQEVKDTTEPSPEKKTTEIREIPEETKELIRSLLKVLIAQRRVAAFSVNLTSLTQLTVKAIASYLTDIPDSVIREHVKKEIEAMGYKVLLAQVRDNNKIYQMEIVLLHRSFDELVDLITSGRMHGLVHAVWFTEIDPKYDKRIEK
jgi:DNA-binding LacI/PurR family transcriptional regulator